MTRKIAYINHDAIQLNLSVIIPVYNCERFIAKAIESSLMQPEVTEVVVVVDGSQDKSLAICQALQSQDNRVKIFQHPNGDNKGRSASRNLALQKATGNYIAFLDADDYYLENRFTNDFKLFQSDENCDGIYNAVGFHYYRAIRNEDSDENKLDIISCKVTPENLFDVLWYGKHGHFHIDGFTVKTNVFKVAGLFNESLFVSEDTDLLWKIAIKFCLVPGIVDRALAKRGIHETNVFNRPDLYKIYTFKMYESLLYWSSKHKVSYDVKDLILKRIWIIKQKEKNSLIVDIKYWNSLFVFKPSLFLSKLSLKYFPIIRYRQSLFPRIFK
jgi:glycosyltransferase involved in cell wall biosynthesis